MPAHRVVATCLAACLALLASPDAQAHGGGLNKDGCHNNRKTGDYHCHLGPAAAAPPMQLAPPARNRTPRVDLAPGNRSPAPSGAYRNCTEARAAGAAPVHHSGPGCGAHLDRDGDWIGCEPYRGR